MDESRPRLWLLDGLRGVAALGVLGFHYLDHAGELYPQLAPRHEWAHFGYYGVHFFFVISGFVIFSSARESSVKQFAVHRWIRLFPTYWLAILLTTVVVSTWGLPGREVGPGATIVNLSMVQEYLGVRHVDGVYWTLTIELLFYVVVAILARAGLLRDERIVWVGVTVLAAVVAMSVVTTSPPGALQPVLFAFGWMPLFIAGIGARLVRSGKVAQGIPLMLGALAVLALVDRARVAPTAVAAALVLLLSTPRAPGWSRRPAEYLGNLSYPLYLVHQNIGYVIMLELAAAGVGRGPSIVVATGIAVLLGTVIAYAYDLPVRRWLRGRIAVRETPGTTSR